MESKHYFRSSSQYSNKVPNIKTCKSVNNLFDNGVYFAEGSDQAGTQLAWQLCLTPIVLFQSAAHFQNTVLQ